MNTLTISLKTKTLNTKDYYNKCSSCNIYFIFLQFNDIEFIFPTPFNHR